MKKIPHLMLVVALALFTSASSCDKKVKPNTEQIDSCKECAGDFKFELKNEFVNVNFDPVNKKWILSNDKFQANIPCKFPEILLIEGKTIQFDGKAFEPEGKTQKTYYEICIKKIY